jgi:hypothetical protein
MYRFENGKPVEVVGSQEVTCPSDTLPAEMTVIGPGDSLILTWTILHKTKRSVGKRAKAGMTGLAVPEQGWALDCGNGESHRVYGMFVTEDGLVEELVLEGKPGKFWSRLALTVPSMPDPPERVRLRLSWEPLTPGPAVAS